MEEWLNALPRDSLGFIAGFVVGCAMPTISRAGYALASLARLVRPRR